MARLEPGLLRVVTDLERGLRALGVPFAVVGALVPELLLASRPARMTNDADVAVSVDSLADFDALKNGLTDFGFAPTRASHRLQHRSGGLVDVLPFSRGIAPGGRLELQRDLVLNMAGFEHVVPSAVAITIDDGPTLPVIPLPLYAVLKLVAFTDRKAGKDLASVFHCLRAYLENDERRYGAEHDGAGVPFEYTGAYLLGLDGRPFVNAPVAQALESVLSRFADADAGGVSIVLGEQGRMAVEDCRYNPPMRSTPLALAFALAASLVGPATHLPAQTLSQPEFPSGWTPKTTQFANRDMVAAANPLAVEAGVTILGKGGSAIDAAIAVQMMLTLVEPQSSGIGGGAFLMYYDGTAKKLVGYDGRETAPAAATPDQFMKLGKPLDFLDAVTGGLSVGTPGVVSMMALAHAKHGTLPWAALFQPAIELAEKGFPISPRLFTTLGFMTQRLCREKAVAAHYLKPDCTPKDEGALLKNPELAATLRAIAKDGPKAFYSGPIAEAIVNAVRSHPTNPGRLTLQDLASYTPKVREPICGPYRGLRICGMPPESSGTIAVLQTLGILEHFDVAKLAPNSLDAVHLISEAYRLAFADRQKFVGDPDFLPVPVAGLLDAGYLKQRSTLISMDKTMGVPVAGNPAGAEPRGLDDSLSLPSTSHVSIVDKHGNMVAMTTTVESGFGSLQMVKGFILNNQLTDFSLSPTDADGQPVANRVEAGKRPRSSMAPSFVFNAKGDVEAVVGSPGGSNIIQYVVKTLVGLVDWKLDIQAAIDLPNFGAQTSAVTEVEKGTVLAALQPALAARGHTVSVVDINSGLQGIVFNGMRGKTPAPFAKDPGKGRLAGGADPRREGTAKGHR